MAGTMVLPLGLVGLFGALAWADFGVPLRLVMGLLGSIAIAVTVWLPSWILVGAWAGRSRIRATAEGVLIEQGTVRPRRSVWLSPRDRITVTRPQADELGRGGLVMAAGSASVRVGIGQRVEDVGALKVAIEGVIAAGAEGPLTRPVASDALGPTWRESLGALWRDVLFPLRHPTPYLMIDLLAIVAAPLLATALEAFDWRDAYPLAFAGFCLGLALRRFDGSYVGGMRHYAAEPTWGLRYLGAAVAIALFATVGLAPRLGLVPAFTVATALTIGLHVLALRRAKTPPPARLPRGLDFALGASLVPISILHESAMFSFIGDSSRGLGPLALAIVPVTAAFTYLPVRMHAFVDDADDRGNLAWFWITVGWLTLQPLLTLGPAIAAEM